MAELDKNVVRQYGANVYRLAQQKGSILRPYVRIEEMKGEKRHFERVKPTSAVRITSKYQQTPLIHTEFDRRTLHAQEFGWGDMIDWQDDLNILIDPTSSVVQQGMSALGRVIDEIIIANGFDGYAYEGKDGLTPVAFPEKQKIAITVGSENASSVGLTYEKLIRARSMFGKADIDLDDPGNELCIAVTQTQMDDLAHSVELGNRDYEAIRDLYVGKTNKFLGFTFVRCNKLTASAVTGGLSRKCVAWCKSGVILALPQDISMQISTRDDMCYNWQAFGKLKGGATRIEDEKVIQIFCFEQTA